MEVQTRNAEGATIQHPTIKDAFDHAMEDETVWKISWTNAETNERVRLVKEVMAPKTIWIWEPII